MATLLRAVSFYALAAHRAVPAALSLAQVAVVGLAVVGPATLGQETLTMPRPWPLVAIALVQG